jgi:hypothetical protein
MPTTYDFVPFSKDDAGNAFTATFDDNDQITALEGAGADDLKETVLEDPQFYPFPWWRTGFGSSYQIIEKGTDEGEAEVDTGTSKLEVTKLDIDKRLVFGWAYVTHDEQGNVQVDKSGEFVDDYDELERAAYEFVVKSRRAGDMHRGDFTAGTMIESMVFTPEKISKMGLPPGSMKTGWWVGFKIENDAVWQAVKNGERPAFSIHGKASKESFDGS